MKIKIEKPSAEKLKELGVEKWPIWEKEASEFPWHYDTREVCYLLEGKVIVEAEGQQVEFGAGTWLHFLPVLIVPGGYWKM